MSSIDDLNIDLSLDCSGPGLSKGILTVLKEKQVDLDFLLSECRKVEEDKDLSTTVKRKAALKAEKLRGALSLLVSVRSYLEMNWTYSDFKVTELEASLLTLRLFLEKIADVEIDSHADVRSTSYVQGVYKVNMMMGRFYQAHNQAKESLGFLSRNFPEMKEYTDKVRLELEQLSVDFSLKVAQLLTPKVEENKN